MPVTEVTGLGVLPLLVLAVIVLAAVIGIFVYFLVYRRHINKALTDDYTEVRQKPQHRMPSFGTVMIVICAVAMAVFMIYVTAELGDLYERISEINSNVNRLSWNLHLDMQSYVDEALREQNSLITSASYETGAFDPKTNRVEVTFTVVPKSTGANAELSLSVGGETVGLEHVGGGRYEGTMSADIFRDYGESILMISDDEGRRTQVIYELCIRGLWYEYLPNVNADISSYSVLERDRFCAGVTVMIYDPVPDNGHTVTSAKLITEIDGRVADEKDVLRISDAANGGVEVPIDVKVPTGGRQVTIYLLATDSMGYTYKSFVDTYFYVDNGSSNTQVVVPDDVCITDENGVVLYGGK